MIYIQLHRFVNDCVKIDIIPLNTKKLYRTFPKDENNPDFVDLFHPAR